MAKTAKKGEKKTQAKAGALTKLLIVLLLAALCVQLHSLHQQVSAAQGEKEALAQQVAAQQQENDALQERIDSGGSEEEMREIARDELGLADSDEKIIYDISN